MSKIKLALQYYRYAENGYDILDITHGYETSFANADRQIGNHTRRSAQG
jgi:hypothetical protein